jgi:hypothetical protein
MAFYIVEGLLSCYKERNVLVPFFCVYSANNLRIFYGAECLIDWNRKVY